MRFLLDVDVVWEGARRPPDLRVATWIQEHSPLDFALSVLTLGEIRSAIHALGAGARRPVLERWLESEVRRQFRDRILPVDDAVAREWGRLTAEGRQVGRPLPTQPGLLLATAARHGLVLVTRNARDCRGRGVPILDLWSD